MKTLQYDLDTGTGVVTLTFDDLDASVNTFNDAWRTDMQAALDRMSEGGSRPRGVILASAKDTFFAGANLKDVLAQWPADPAQVFARTEAGKKLLRRLETLGCPVVACIAGSALGGGFELALCAHHRVVVDDARVQLGFPEVGLGLIPAGGGVTKLVRLLGLESAMPYILESRVMSPSAARDAGLVHAVVPSGLGAAAALREAALAWIEAHPQAQQPWDVKGHRIPGGAPGCPKLAPLQMLAPAMLFQKTRGRYPAAEAALSCMVEGAQLDVDTALRLETRALVGLLTHPVTRNLIQLFFDRNAVRRGRSRPQGVAPWQAGKVSILGAGMMGAGIAQVCAAHSLNVVLKDVSIEFAEAGKERVRRLTDQRVHAGRMTPSQQAVILERIEPAAEVSALDGSDLIIETVFEDRALKGRATGEAEPCLRPDGVFASNTSTLPITGLAEAVSMPERFIGLHFFSPADRMELVEIVVAEKTSAETLARAYDFVLQIGKTPIVVRDARGFFTSRTVGSYMAEGAQMLAEGIPATVVELAGRDAGMPVGPLTVADEISLVTLAKIMEQNASDALDVGERFMIALCRQHGRKGRVLGGGYYDYTEDAPKTLWPGLKAFERPEASWTLAALSERLLMRQAVEALRCEAEGVVTHAHDANVGSVLGFGFPAWTGGVLQYVAAMGRDRFMAQAHALAAAHGGRFTP